jgi:hypothetical protein
MTCGETAANILRANSYGADSLSANLVVRDVGIAIIPTPHTRGYLYRVYSTSPSTTIGKERGSLNGVQVRV